MANFLYRILVVSLELFLVLHVMFLALRSPLVFLWMRLTGRSSEIPSKVESIAISFYQSVFRLFHCEVRVEGLENIPSDRAFIVMVNHQSKFDIPLLGGFLGRSMGFVAKKELFRLPGFSYWAKQTNCLPLDRSDVAGGVAAMAELAKKLKKVHGGLIIFPEGTRSKDAEGAIQMFKRGSLRAATEHNLPVLPVSLDGTRFLDRMDCMRATHGGGRYVRLLISPVMEAQAQSAPERKAIMDALHDTIAINRKGILVSWPNCT